MSKTRPFGPSRTPPAEEPTPSSSARLGDPPHAGSSSSSWETAPSGAAKFLDGRKAPEIRGGPALIRPRTRPAGRLPPPARPPRPAAAGARGLQTVIPQEGEQAARGGGDPGAKAGFPGPGTAPEASPDTVNSALAPTDPRGGPYSPPLSTNRIPEHLHHPPEECFQRRVDSGGECGAPRGRGAGIHGVRGASGGVPARGPGVSPDLCPPRAPLAPCFHPPETLHSVECLPPVTGGRQEGTRRTGPPGTRSEHAAGLSGLGGARAVPPRIDTCRCYFFFGS